jgi:glycosyltransferase involved in cell wall biosynthesis
MRVLQIVQRPQRRGAEVFAYDLSRRLEVLGVTVGTLYLYTHEEDSALPLHERDRCLQGVERHPFEKVPGFEPILLAKVIRGIRRFRPDIVQVNGARTVKYGAFARHLAGSGARWKLVYRNIGMASHWHRWRGSIAAYRRAIIPRMDGVIGVSSASLRDVQDFYKIRSPSVVILNGVNPERLRPKHSRLEFRNTLDVSEENVVLLTVGSLDSAKRPDRFLRVLSRIGERLPQVRAWIVGDGPGREEAERYAGELGVNERVRFFGTREDVADFMQASDIFVMTSDTEGVPAVVLEAGLMGLPIVATRVGGLSECVIDGTTGELVMPTDEVAMSNTIAALALDNAARKRMGSAGRDRVRMELTIESIAAQYLDFYRFLLDELPAPIQDNP